ncbi:MAG: hypothetical protein F6J93_17440 [Oscillatoria sp. SIO1A7]|nr:hypothetical protein [Oscillatoria sp. SIO1A7]
MGCRVWGVGWVKVKSKSEPCFHCSLFTLPYTPHPTPYTLTLFSLFTVHFSLFPTPHTPHPTP